MGLAAVNDTVLFTVRGLVTGQRHLHTLHFRALAPLADEQNVIDFWQADCRATYRALFGDTQSPCIEYKVQQICGTVPLRAPIAENEVAPNIVGATGAYVNPTPSFVASLTSVKTALAGRTRQGRYFIGGLDESQVSANTLVNSIPAALVAYSDALLGAFGPGGTHAGVWALVVHSKKLASVPGTDCQDSSTIVTGMVVSPNPTTMRSRKLGHGD